MSAKTEGIAPNASRLLVAGFMAILAAGVGFAIRGGIFDNWGAEFGFSGAQLGAIGGAGFTGFCVGIVVGGFVADKIGYGWLVTAAFVFHIASAVITFMATPSMGQDGAFAVLTAGMFVFALANGTLEAVANPLVSTLFPENRTHYLNILHASWPAGMVLGAVVGWFLDEGMGLHWKLQLALYLVPTLIYALMFMGQKFPKSEASAKGVPFGDMLKDVGILGGVVASFFLGRFAITLPTLFGFAPLPGIFTYIIAAVLFLAIAGLSRFSIGSFMLFILFIAHALVGAVELGTDQWIQNITGNILSPTEGKILFIWTSALMFGLRFCAHFIEKNLKLSPVGILLVCAMLACAGLQLTSMASGFMMAMAALTVYALGKTFFWPTMLAVVGDRFPRSGAVAMSIMGGIGMMSAGLFGSPGLGYAKDRFASEELKKTNVAVYEANKAQKPSEFEILPNLLKFANVVGIDGMKLADAKKANPKSPEQDAIVKADQQGDRNTLKADSFIPATMAIIYLLLLLYFRIIGGYKPVHIAEELTGGVAGPMQA
ncbi:MAG: MFS transporter [Prosthecobacter sp.]|nr:MFS transporter [Prosthecobacter sp.]